ncbi:MAG: hypothetical protein EA398_14240 [Deltaproteobacteria bacterium]|nr:MAG: hypothetical protein EA398_14240 [Deltaproteobacteria bacterium]
MRPSVSRPLSRRLHLAGLSLALLVVLLPPQAEAIVLLDDEESGLRFEFTGYVQPYLRFVENACVPTGRSDEDCRFSEVTNGFGLQRARLQFTGQSNRFGTYRLELRTIPNVELLEAEVRFPILDGIGLSVGRYKVPFSRQELVSESRLQLIDRASFIKFTPGRQLGMHATFSSNLLPFGLPDDLVLLHLGVFNGESDKERAPVNNIDSDMLYGARLEVHPFGRPEQLFESDVRSPEDRRTPLLSLGGNLTYEERGPGNENYREQQLGADLFAAWHGASLAAEFYRRDRDYRNNVSDVDQYATGWMVQGGFFVPVRPLDRFVEIAGRVEDFRPATAVDPDRAAEILPQAPGSGPRLPNNTQSHRDYVVGLNLFLDGHDLKLQINYTHRYETGDWRLSIPDEDGMRASRQVDDDSLFIQLTYRF